MTTTSSSDKDAFMRAPGLGMLTSHMRNRKPTKQCERCGLRYEIDEENCPHCHGLSDAGVAALKKRFAREQIGNHRLGKMLLIAATFGLLLIFVFGLLGD